MISKKELMIRICELEIIVDDLMDRVDDLEDNASKDLKKTKTERGEE